MFRAGVALLALASAVAVAVAYWNTGKSFTSGNVGPVAPVPTLAEPKQVPFTPATQRAVNAVLARFVAEAVTRSNVAPSYELATRSMRQGMSRRVWAKGTIPVPTYPARDGVEISRVISSYRNDVVFDALLQPRAHSNVGPMAISVEMKAVGSGARRRWLVDSMYTSAVFPAANAPVTTPKTRVLPKTAAKPDYGAGHLSAKWFLLPVLILGLILLIPVGFAINGWYQRRKAYRHYAEG